MTAAEELRDAAARMEKLAASATPGPWYRPRRHDGFLAAPKPDDEDRRYLDGRAERVTVVSVERWQPGNGFVRARSGRDLDWIGTLSPATAPPMVALLRAAAAAADEYPALDDPTSHLSRMAADPDQAGSYRHTADLIRTGLSLARLINGAAS